MKPLFVALLISFFSLSAVHVSAQTNKPDTTVQLENGKHLYIDVHQLEPGKVKFADVAEAHKKDLAVESKYGVNFVSLLRVIQSRSGRRMAKLTDCCHRKSIL